MFKVNKQISKEIIRTTNSIHVGEMNISGLNYFVKPDDEFKEIIGYHFAKMLDLDCVKYQSIKVNHKNYVVSKDLKEQSKFMLAHFFSFNGMELNEILDALRSFPFFNENLEKDVMKMYLYDILFMNDDRHDRNWGLKFLKEARLVLLDNGNIFRIYGRPYIRYDQSFYFDEDNHTAWAQDFLAFYESLSDENQEMITELTLKANGNRVKAIFSMIEHQYKTSINPKFLKIYEDHYEQIKNIIRNSRWNYGR